MKATIQKWGNSLGVRIPGHMAKDLLLKNGSDVEIIAENNRIIIQPRTIKLDELLSQITEDNMHSEQFNIPAGKESL